MVFSRIYAPALGLITEEGLRLEFIFSCGDRASTIKAPALAMIMRELIVFYGCEVFIY